MPEPKQDDNHIPDNHMVMQFIGKKDIEVIPILMTSPLMIKNDPLLQWGKFNIEKILGIRETEN